ncbi:MAG TPA: cytidine deaminase [Kofleriaceae bacterium]|nr:cytidine deaminase [Kofleriaceae bacterium]
MSPSEEDLIAAALAARDRAYAPYSGYHVGSAVSAGGQIFVGANVENASYGLTLCAERAAVSIAVLAGHRSIDAVALATDSSPPAAPCGMCLQTLAEFAADPAALPVIAVNSRGERQRLTLAQLLPHGFTGAALRART